MVSPLKVGILHPYLEGRDIDIISGKYPYQHSWACISLSRSSNFTTEVITPSNFNFPQSIIKIINRVFFPRSAGFNYEFGLSEKYRHLDLIYSVSGPLSSVNRLKKTKLVSWVFRPPAKNPTNPFDPYHKSNLKKNHGFLCLTPTAEKYFSHFAPSRFIPWCVDLDLFDGNPPLNQEVAPFFLATGKTERDYKTLIESCKMSNINLRIIGPADQKPNDLPENIMWVSTSTDPPDQAIDYKTLREWYAQCLGVCIPLKGDPEDTCGYTNLLEAMAMRKPVIMTKSGCLHINPAARKCGILVNPNDSSGWASAMNELSQNSTLRKELGNKGRDIAEKEFAPYKFDSAVKEFLYLVLGSDLNPLPKN